MKVLTRLNLHEKREKKKKTQKGEEERGLPANDERTPSCKRTADSRQIMSREREQTDRQAANELINP